MRNCFIPKCDQLNRNNPKRAMFNVPVKDPILFQQWAAVLPKHRDLKEFDRICENHFQEEDIQRYWEHTINGQVERMERKKPALRPNAVPCFPESDAEMYQVAKNSTKRKQTQKTKPKKLKLEVTSDAQIPVESKKVEHDIVQKTTVTESGLVELSIHKINDTIEGHNVEHNIVIEVTQLAHPDFETLFDEVYEVELPTTLWGIHRDNEKTFISFTEFNKESMNIRKYLYIDQCLQYRMVVGQRVMKIGTLPNGSIEAITDLLAKLEEVKIRKVIVKGSSTVLNES